MDIISPTSKPLVHNAIGWGFNPYRANLILFLRPTWPILGFLVVACDWSMWCLITIQSLFTYANEVLTWLPCHFPTLSTSSTWCPWARHVGSMWIPYHHTDDMWQPTTHPYVHQIIQICFTRGSLQCYHAIMLTSTVRATTSSPIFLQFFPNFRA